MPQISFNSFCGSCKDEKCGDRSGLVCFDPLKCRCKCNINGFVDLVTKFLSFSIGLFVVVGGLYLSGSSQQMLAQIASSALISTGLNSLLKQSIAHSFRSERLYLFDILRDAVFCSLAGLTTGALITLFEELLLDTKVTLVVIFTRAFSGALVSIATKFIERQKSSSTSNGKTFWAST